MVFSRELRSALLDIATREIAHEEKRKAVARDVARAEFGGLVRSVEKGEPEWFDLNSEARKIYGEAVQAIEQDERIAGRRINNTIGESSLRVVKRPGFNS